MNILIQTLLGSFLVTHLVTSELGGPGDILISFRWVMQKMGMGKVIHCKYCFGFWASGLVALFICYLQPGAFSAGWGPFLASLPLALAGYGFTVLAFITLDYASTFIEAYYDFVYLPYNNHEDDKEELAIE